MKVVCTSGYYNPVHIGHIRLFKEAQKGGNFVVVIVNNDEQVKLKGSKPFMNEKERMEVISSIKYVDKVILSIDKDRTIRETLKRINPDIFMKGGDSTPENTPELELCKELGIKVEFGVGGGKIQSSSWLKDGTI
jgi:cytidyltransferase-like protein